MSNFLKTIAKRRDKEDAVVILWEVEKAFEEASPASPARVLPMARELRDLVRFAQCDAIAEWLRNERAALECALRFAQRIGDETVAGIVKDALDGRAQPDAVFSVQLRGQEARLIKADAGEVTRFDGVDWGGTDIALSFAMEDFAEAVLDELVAAAGVFELPVPASVSSRQAADVSVDKDARLHSVGELVRRVVEARNPRIEAGTDEQVEKRLYGQGVELPVTHQMNPPATADSLGDVRQRFGAAAEQLLEACAMHDGGALFQRDGECGFYLGRVAEWDELHSSAIEWAEGVTWQHEPEEIPGYLYSAIAFGMIPGDSERWLLITEGEHAGKIMLSDTDLVDDQPRFESFAHFLSALLNDAARVIGCGGYVRYDVDGVERYPLRYLTD